MEFCIVLRNQEKRVDKGETGKRGWGSESGWLNLKFWTRRLRGVLILSLNFLSRGILLLEELAPAHCRRCREKIKGKDDAAAAAMVPKSTVLRSQAWLYRMKGIKRKTDDVKCIVVKNGSELSFGGKSFAEHDQGPEFRPTTKTNISIWQRSNRNKP